MDKKNKNAGKRNSDSDKLTADGRVRSGFTSREYAEYGVRYNVWDQFTERGHWRKKHPAPFPEALARDHILSWSNEGDVVLDPFSGSGTTAKMAYHNGRRFIGIEINPEYVEISKNRLSQKVLF
jgi:site-specific DNA-methyltransferase (adenine-specific)